MIFKLPFTCHTLQMPTQALRGSQRGNGSLNREQFLNSILDPGLLPKTLIENTAKIVWKPLILSNVPVLSRR